jgi:hypothetical protein
MRVPEDADEVAVSHDADVGAFGVWRDKEGRLYVAGYHFGPASDVLFRIHPDGNIECADELS